jgi:hypothetical protein
MFLFILFTVNFNLGMQYFSSLQKTCVQMYRVILIVASQGCTQKNLLITYKYADIMHADFISFIFIHMSHTVT